MGRHLKVLHKTINRLINLKSINNQSNFDQKKKSINQVSKTILLVMETGPSSQVPQETASRASARKR